jgi:hypothetical protein
MCIYFHPRMFLRTMETILAEDPEAIDIRRGGSQSNHYTFFVPTDEAFRSIGDSRLRRLQSDQAYMTKVTKLDSIRVLFTSVTVLIQHRNALTCSTCWIGNQESYFELDDVLRLLPSQLGLRLANTTKRGGRYLWRVEEDEGIKSTKSFYVIL